MTAALGEHSLPWTPHVESADLDIFEAINVRLRPGRIPTPDLAIARGADPDGPTMQLYHHEDGRYVEQSAGAPGIPLVFVEPISATIDPATLVRSRR
jgi:hypothetical protein